MLDEVYNLEEGFFARLRADLPINAHRMLLELCVKLGVYSFGEGDSAITYEDLHDVFVLRLKYRHFFEPPLVEIDVLVSEFKDPEVPGGFVRLTDDLNQLSTRNARVAVQDAQMEANAGDDGNDNPKARLEKEM